VTSNHNYESHCGRKIVSKTWGYCPYCGLSFDTGLPAPDPTPKKTARAGKKGQTVRPDGSVRAAPLKGRKPALASAERPLMCQHVCTRGPMAGQMCSKPYPDKKGHRHNYRSKKSTASGPGPERILDEAGVPKGVLLDF